jgi:hypothetical protein
LATVALDCFRLLDDKKQPLFFSEKEKKEAQKRRKKGYAIPKQWSGGCQGFLNKKYYPQGGDFFSKTRRA